MKSFRFRSLRKSCKKIAIILANLFLLQITATAQNTTTATGSTEFQKFIKLLPYINGLVTILVFIGAFKGIQKILRSDPDGKVDLMYAGLGAAAYAGLYAAIVLLN